MHFLKKINDILSPYFPSYALHSKFSWFHCNIPWSPLSWNHLLRSPSVNCKSSLSHQKLGQTCIHPRARRNWSSYTSWTWDTHRSWYRQNSYYWFDTWECYQSRDYRAHTNLSFDFTLSRDWAQISMAKRKKREVRFTSHHQKYSRWIFHFWLHWS